MLTSLNLMIEVGKNDFMAFKGQKKRLESVDRTNVSNSLKIMPRRWRQLNFVWANNIRLSISLSALF